MDPLDTALDILRDTTSPRFRVTHGPMAAEALVSLGGGDRVVDWARDHRKELLDYEVGGELPGGEWEAALGSWRHLGAWVGHFDAELDAGDWRGVAGRWLPRFLPAIACDAAHGVIRAGHALRNLRSKVTPARLHELAEALGFWGAGYAQIAGRPPRDFEQRRPERPSATLPEALAALPQVPFEAQTFGTSIDLRLRALSDLEGFADAVSAFEPGPDLGSFVDDLAHVSAHLYLVNAPRGRVIEFVHALDGVLAVRELLPHLGMEEARRAAFHGWQTIAALHAACGGPIDPTLADVPEAPAATGVAALVERAIDVGGPHALKFAQACLLEHSNQPDAIFHACLADMVERMEQLRDRVGLLV